MLIHLLNCRLFEMPWRIWDVIVMTYQSVCDDRFMSHTRRTMFMGLLLDTQNCGLRMHREYRERFPLHRLQRKSLVSDSGMHHGTCVMHVTWCMSGSLTRSGGENVSGIPGACATHNFVYLARGPWWAWCIFHRFLLWISKPFYPGRLSLKSFTFNPSMDEWSYPL